MAEDTQALIAKLRASRNAATAAVPVGQVPETTFATSQDQSRAYSQDLLRSLGYDDATIEAVSPMGAGAGVAETMPTDSLDGLGARIESQQLVGEQAANGVAIAPRIVDRIDQFLEQHGDRAVAGLASINKQIDKITSKAGELAAKRLTGGSTNLTLGMALLDNFTRLDNTLKIDLFAPEEKKALLKLQYLPKEKLVDPSIAKEFSTASDMALWAAGQRVWGAANELAALPPEMLGKALGSLGFAEASAYLEDIAARDKAVAAKQDQLVTGQLPQMVAGMAPAVKYQDIWESGFDPQELDDIYAQMADPGNHGTLTAAAISGLGALADFYGSPTVALSMIPARLTQFVPAAMRSAAPGKAAQITSEIARKSYRWEDAKEAVRAADKVVERTKTRLDQANEAGLADVQQQAERRYRLALEAQAREEHWAAQFQDPGTYEPIMPRPARRNPDYIPELTERQYPLSAAGRSSVRVKGFEELAQEPIEAKTPRWMLVGGVPLPSDTFIRRQTLRQGAHQPVDWENPATITLGAKTQRMTLGPNDAEYAGDALNMLARGAEIDDVSMAAGLAPEYAVLPDVQTSLIDIRKITETNRFEAARRVTEAQTKVATPSASVLSKRLEAAGVEPTAEPGSRLYVRPEEMLKRNEELTRDLLRSAKRRGDKAGADELRRQLRQLQKVRGNLAMMGKEPFDPRMLPAKQKSIMESPERFNNWLGVAGDRVIRSLYPGGLLLHGWSSKLGQMTGMAREPMRYYMSYDPAAWERIRSGVMRNDRFTKAGYNMLIKEMESAGVMKTRSDFNIAKHFAPQKVDKAKSQELFRMLNTTTKSDEHLKMYEAATPEMRRAHDRIRVVLDHFADLQGISGTQRYLTGYMRHVFDAGLFKGGARPIEFIGLPAKAELFASHLQQRAGTPGYLEDSVLALDLYMRAAYRKLIMEPVYDDIITTGTELAKKHGNTAHISYANDLVNQLKGKPSFVGAKIDEAVGAAWNSGGGVRVPFTDKRLRWQPGQTDRTALGIFGLVHSGLTTGPHYAILQLASGLMTTESRVGPLDTMRGVFAMATKEGQQLAKAAGTYKPFVDFLESPTTRRFTEAVQTKVKSPPLFMSNQQAEDMSRGITYNAAVKMNLRKAGYKNLQEAEEAGEIKRIMFESARVAEEANHLYGPLGRSPWVTRLMGTAGATGTQQLLSYIPKQTEELLGQTARNPGYILQYLAFSGHLTRQMANLGIDMTGDVGLGYLPEGPGDITSPAVDAGLDNLRLLDALDRGDAEGVEKYAKAMTKSLLALVPGSQTTMAVSKAAQRLGEDAVRTGAGEKLYSMQMEPQAGGGLGGELLPTVLLQRNIRETLTRRAVQANRQEDKRLAYNAAKALEDYAEALETGDAETAERLSGELGNVYKVGLVNVDQFERIQEARSVAYTIRSVLSTSGVEQQLYLENFRKHGVNLEP